MENISYTAHVSNKKSAITSKSKLAAVAKHNLRKYKSSDYSKDNICIIYGTSNLIDDVKTVYHKEFDEALEEYNKKQTRPDRKIDDYFEHVAGKEQDMAVEIIIQIGDREFWRQFDDMKSYMKLSYQIILDELRKRLPQFVVANAVVHLDEDSPHMHIVGVPVADGYKKGLSKQVSKRKAFTKDMLSRVLQDELREVANKEVNDWFGKQIKEKSKGRNYDLSVAEYKVAQETKHLTQLQKQVEESDMTVKANKAVEKEYTDKKEKLETDISYLESMRRITKSLSEMDSRESKQISMELDKKRAKLQSVNEELASAIEKAEDATKLLDRIKNFVSSFRLFAPTIEEYANQVEADKTIEAGNSFRGILNELGKLLEAFKELIKEGKTSTAILGFNSAKGVFYKEKFEETGAKVYIMTADGSVGEKGLVTDKLREISYSYFYACGPEAMFRAMEKVVSSSGEYSFEEKMGCGFGACMGCSKKTKSGSKRVCKEGPVFKREEIIL